MNKRILGNLINFLLFGGYGVFCWYYSYLKPDYDSLSAVVEILKYLGIFIAARMGAAVLHQLGHVFFAVFMGFGVMYFEACFFKLWHDGERVRFGLFFDPRLIFSGSVMIKLKDTFDTPAGFKKNRSKYSKFILGGLIFNLAAIVIAVIIYALCLSFGEVFSPLFLAALSVMIGCWFMVYNAFSEDAGRRGDFIAFTQSRDSESLVISLAAQSIVEGVDHGFLFKEAQRVIAFKIKNGLPWMERYSVNVLSAVAFYSCAGKAAFDPEIEEYLATEFFNREKLENADSMHKLFLVMRIKNFVAYYALNYGRERALEILELAADIYRSMRLRDNSMYIYFCDTKEMLKESLDADGLDMLSYTKFMSSDSYAMGFKNFREINDLAEDNVHQAIYNWNEPD